MNPILNLNFLKVTADGERASSQAVVAPKKPCLDAPKLARKIPISIEEQALMDYLFQTGSIAVQEKQGLGAILPPLQPKYSSMTTLSNERGRITNKPFIWKPIKTHCLNGEIRNRDNAYARIK